MSMYSWLIIIWTESLKRINYVNKPQLKKMLHYVSLLYTSIAHTYGGLAILLTYIIWHKTRLFSITIFMQFSHKCSKGNTYFNGNTLISQVIHVYICIDNDLDALFIVITDWFISKLLMTLITLCSFLLYLLEYKFTKVFAVYLIIFKGYF
jgi:hypothetical protein